MTEAEFLSELLMYKVLIAILFILLGIIVTLSLGDWSIDDIRKSIIKKVGFLRNINIR